MWSDGWFVSLDIYHRYLFQYLLTNAHTHICGIYELPLPIMAAETSIRESVLIKMIGNLEGKIFYINGWVYLKNFTKHQTKSETIEKGIKAGYALVPQKIRDKIDTIDTLYLHEQVFEPELEPKLKLEPESKGGPASNEASKTGDNTGIRKGKMVEIKDLL